MSAAPPCRRAQPEDAAAIAALVNRAYAKYVLRIGRKPMPMLADYADAIRRHDVWVAESDGTIVAALVLIPEAETLLIENIAVDPAHQGGGLGRTLMTFAESEARRQGYASIRLYTNEKMTENIAIYGRLGYRETGRETLRGLHVVHMRKELGDDT
jgi:ribosomal protein S18 acetylase RimI-like enzyme